MRRVLFALLIVPLSICAQAQKFDLETDHFKVTLPDSHSLFINKNSADDYDIGQPKE